MFGIFKSREQREIEELTKRLVKTIVKSDQLKQLIVNAKKQWEFDDLKTHTLSYPIIQDLVNAAAIGVSIEVNLAGGSTFKILPEKQHEEAPGREPWRAHF